MADLSVYYRQLSAVYLSMAEALEAQARGEPMPAMKPAPAQPGLQPLKPQVFTPPAAPTESPEPSPGAVRDVNVATHCPKHGTEYRRGNYGLYCPNPTDDPAFADRKGYCNLPGQNAQRALAWINIQERAANVR